VKKRKKRFGPGERELMGKGPVSLRAPLEGRRQEKRSVYGGARGGRLTLRGPTDRIIHMEGGIMVGDTHKIQMLASHVCRRWVNPRKPEKSREGQGMKGEGAKLGRSVARPEKTRGDRPSKAEKVEDRGRRKKETQRGRGDKPRLFGVSRCRGKGSRKPESPVARSFPEPSTDTAKKGGLREMAVLVGFC